MIKVIPHSVLNDFDLPYRTEDIRFSPSGRRLAVVATDGCIILYAVDTNSRPVELAAEVELRSPALLVPHGVEFLSEDVFVVANRNGNLAFFRLPAQDQWDRVYEIVPILQVQSHLFGTTGVTRKLRDRDLYCGPGSVRFFDDILYVCCNYKNTVSTFRCQLNENGVMVEEGEVIACEGLEVVDGIAISRDGGLMALSDHDHHRVAVYRRAGGSSPNKPRYELACSLRDEDMHYAHGLCFDRDGKTLYVADAGGRFLHVFRTPDGWKMDAHASTLKTRGVDEQAFTKSQEIVPLEHRMLEGGLKGLDIDPSGKVVAVTCRNQVLRFLEFCDEGQSAHADPHSPPGAVEEETEIALSCLVDDTPAFWKSIVPWMASAIVLAGIEPTSIHIHHVCPLRPHIAQLCTKLGIHTHPVQAFDRDNPHANKIAQGSTRFGLAKSIVLTDVDVVFTAPPPFAQMSGLIAGKPVDMPNPPLAILQEIFKRADVAFIGACPGRYVDNGQQVTFETLIGNFNGGLYIVPSDVLGPLTRRWAYWTRWLIEHISLLGPWKTHADQVGFCIAVNEMRSPVRILDHAWNYPGHIGQPHLYATPWLLHHHARLDDAELLLPMLSPRAQEGVDLVNEAIRYFKGLHGLRS